MILFKRHYISLKCNKSELIFHSKDGSLQKIRFQKKTISLHGKPFFTLGLRNNAGELQILSSADFHFTTDVKDDILSFHYTGYANLEVTVTVFPQGDFFHFRPEIWNVPKDLLLEWIDLPQVVVPENGRIFWPRLEGVLIDHPEDRQRSPWSRYHILGFLERSEGIAYSEGGYYPGICQMQFLSWEKDGAVLYFGAHDRKHGTKAVEYEPLPSGHCRLSLQTFCGAANPYVSEFDYVIGFLKGNWMDACSIYRDWIHDDPMLPTQGALPEMVKESPVVVIHPVRGHGDDKGSMKEGNEYFPYINALPAIKHYAKLFDSRILSLLMHWEGTAPWAPPYVWPPFGGVESLKRYSDALHAEKNYLGVYCSGTAWTQKSCIIDYSCEKKCEEENLYKHMIRGPKGEIEAVICCAPQAQRLGFDMCLTEDWSRKTLKDELLKLTECDIDYVQFFDQNLGGCYHACYSRSHKHPELPGSWQTNTMKSLQYEMNALLKKRGSKMILGCEGAAADVYIQDLPFNDLRSCWNYGCGLPVPGYQFVFHEYCNNFMGNQCGITNLLDSEVSPEHLLYRIAYAFYSGDLLSVVLKDNKKIHWGWGALWDMKEPDQRQVITFIRNLNKIRRKYGNFLQYGRMEKNKIRLETETYFLRINGKDIAVPSCLHSAWTAPTGEHAEFVVNFLPKKQCLRLKVPAGIRLAVNGHKHSEKFLHMKPLTAACITLPVCRSEISSDTGISTGIRFRLAENKERKNENGAFRKNKTTQHAQHGGKNDCF